MTDYRIDPLECYKCGNELEATDGTAHYECDWCGTETTLAVTNHASDNWIERVFDSSLDKDDVIINLDILDAWERARPLIADHRDWEGRNPNTVPIEDQLGHRFIADEFRYDAETQMCLLRKDSAIVTVIDAPTARLNCKYSIVQTMIADGDDSSEIASACQEYEIWESQLATIVERERRRRNRATQGEGPASGAVAPDQNPHSVGSTEEQVQ